MLKRYAIWDKESSFKTPCGKTLSAVEVISKYFGDTPIYKIADMVIVCAAGEINGACISSLDYMVEAYTYAGCDFSKCKTTEEKLECIEKFEDELIRTGKAVHDGKYFIGIESMNSCSFDKVEKHDKNDLYVTTAKGHTFWAWDTESIKKFS